MKKLKNNSNSNSRQLIKREKLEGSPFEIIKQENNYFLAVGQYRLTPILESKEAVLDNLTKNMWDIITKLTTIIIENSKTN